MPEIDWDAALLTPLFQQSGIATAAVYMPAAGAPFDITGMWQDTYEQVDALDPDAPTTTSDPALGVQLSQFTAEPLQNDRVQILKTGATYIVREVREDGLGAAKLMLNLETAR